MKAAVLEKFNAPLVIRDIEIPEPAEGEVRIKVMASGLCGSDIHSQEGKVKTVKIPFTPGHEMAGIIDKLGPGSTKFEVGTHVVCAIDISCGVCRFCMMGRPNLCRKLVRIGFERNGSHAQYAVVPEKIVFPVSEDMPWEKAAVIPDAVSCMLHAVKDQGNCKPGDRMCFLGIGGLGLQGVQIAKHFGAEVYCTSRQDKKLEIAKGFGADHCINTANESLKDRITELTGGDMCDVVFDNIGIESSIQSALEIVRPGGRVIVVGYIDSEFRANYQDMMMNEKEVVGVRASNPGNLREAIELVNSGAVDPYVFDVVPLSRINEALDRLKNGKSLGRTVLLPQEE